MFPPRILTRASALVLLSVASANNNSSVDFTLPGGFDEYELHFQNVVPATNAVNFWFRTSADGVTYDSGASNYTGQRLTITGAVVSGSSIGTTEMRPLSTVSNTTANGGVSGVARIIRPAGTTHNKTILWDIAGHDGTDATRGIGHGQRSATAVVAGVRSMFSSGNITSGEFKLYGVKKA